MFETKSMLKKWKQLSRSTSSEMCLINKLFDIFLTSDCFVSVDN